MKKLAVINCYRIKNFGSVLQSYALEKYLHQNTDCEVFSIEYKKKKNLGYVKDYLPQIFIKEVVKMKAKNLKKKLYLKFRDPELRALCSGRDKYFDNFVDKYMTLSPEYCGKEALVQASHEFAGVILGSDQVWHPINMGSHYYTMEWVPNNIPKLTYAASFGVSEIPAIQKKNTKKYLARIQSIAVRENQGANIVEEMTGNRPEVVADPTLLLDTEQWLQIAKESGVDRKDYIFCYFLGSNSDARKAALDIKKKTGLDIVCVPFMDEIIPGDFEFGDEKLYNIGPAEFLAYINNAKYVVTDSFHGTVFSILFHKQFIVFNRYQSNEKGSTNSRIDTLLGTFELAERRIGGKIPVENSYEALSREIEYTKVDGLVEQLKERSKKYLQEALKKFGIVK